jgi:hypothetical protein
MQASRQATHRDNDMRRSPPIGAAALSAVVAAPLLAATVLSSSIGQAAQDEKPFPLTCEGTLDAKGGQYFFAEGDQPLNADADDNIVCAHVTIAEESTGSAVRQSLREETIRRLLGACRVRASCKVSGSVLNLSHDVYVYVRIGAISPK